MASPKLRSQARDAWALVRRQHGVVTRAQLLELGLSSAAIRHRRATRRLHEVHRGVYAVGRGDLDRLGELMAAVLACGSGAQLSHRSAAELIDLATCLSDDEVEDAVNEADRLDLLRTHRLRPALDNEAKRAGVGRLKAILDAQTFSRAQNALERHFLAIVRAAGLPVPDTQRRLGRYRVDFFWPDLGLVVETDSLRHHRTAAEQEVDLGRDQAHARAGLRSLRFTHSQVFHRPDHVRAVLTDAFRHL
jgi:very-short-patch-repair endonuclease